MFIGAGVQSNGLPTPVGPDTLWRLYSMTKPVTGTAALLLIKDGKMKLAPPIADFLPAFANQTVQNVTEGSLPSVPPATVPRPVRTMPTQPAGIGDHHTQTRPNT